MAPTDGGHVAQDVGRSWFWAYLTQTTHIRAIFGRFWAVSRTYCGASGQEMAPGRTAIEAHVKCRNRLPSFGRFEWVSGPFCAKKGHFGAQNAQFWEGTLTCPPPPPPPPGATGEFLAQNLDLARPPPRL